MLVSETDLINLWEEFDVVVEARKFLSDYGIRQLSEFAFLRPDKKTFFDDIVRLMVFEKGNLLKGPANMLRAWAAAQSRAHLHGDPARTAPVAAQSSSSSIGMSEERRHCEARLLALDIPPPPPAALPPGQQECLQEIPDDCLVARATTLVGPKVFPAAPPTGVQDCIAEIPEDCFAPRVVAVPARKASNRRGRAMKGMVTEARARELRVPPPPRPASIQHSSGPLPAGEKQPAQNGCHRAFDDTSQHEVLPSARSRPSAGKAPRHRTSENAHGGKQGVHNSRHIMFDDDSQEESVISAPLKPSASNAPWHRTPENTRIKVTRALKQRQKPVAQLRKRFQAFVSGLEVAEEGPDSKVASSDSISDGEATDAQPARKRLKAVVNTQSTGGSEEDLMDLMAVDV